MSRTAVRETARGERRRKHDCSNNQNFGDVHPLSKATINKIETMKVFKIQTGPVKVQGSPGERQKNYVAERLRNGMQGRGEPNPAVCDHESIQNTPKYTEVMQYGRPCSSGRKKSNAIAIDAKNHENNPRRSFSARE